MIVDNLVEPEIMEILRFCYWVNKSRNIIDNENFERKFSEIRKDLKCNDELDTRKKYGQLFTDIGKVLQDQNLDYENKLKITKKFYNELNHFRKIISSFLPEFMLSCIIKDEEVGILVKFKMNLINFSSQSTVISLKNYLPFFVHIFKKILESFHNQI